MIGLGLLMDDQRFDLSNITFSEEFFCEEIRNGFYLSETMKRHLAAELKVLSEVDKICRRHDLNWYADSGTLLGAIRHDGFIPWDDDVDIAMLREEYELFLSYAEEELPEGYCIAYEGYKSTKRNPFQNYHNPFSSIVNSEKLRDDRFFLEEFYGCPFLSSIDIFPLDRVYTDPQKEAERENKAKLVYTTFCGIVHNDFTEDELKVLIPIIEKDNNISLGTEDLEKKLLQLFIDISKECKDEDSTEIVLMYEWVMRGKYKYKRSCYDSWTEHVFENTKVRIPQNYHEVLVSCYGDYMELVRGDSGHEYPVYKPHERIFRELTGHNPLRYTFKKDEFEPLNERDSLQQKIKNLFGLISELHVYIRKSADSGEVQNECFQNCQEAAVSIGNAIESKFGDKTEAVALLEKYCEKVYELSMDWSLGCLDEMDGLITEAERKAEELFDNCEYEILILAGKIEWWDSLQDVFKLLGSDKRNKVSVIPIPYYYHEFERVIGEVRRDTDSFLKLPELEGIITDFDKYDLESRHPDVIVIQYPYDEYSSVMGIPKLLRSDNLFQYTDRLVYVPYLDPDPPQSEGDVASSAMIELVEQPAVFNSDLVIVGSEGLREFYIKTLVEMTDSSLKDYWEDRVHTKKDLINVIRT